MAEWSDEELLDALRLGDDTAVEITRTRFYPMIYKLVMQQRGTDQDVEDIFHDMLEVILIQRRDNTFKLYSSLSTYIYAICKNLWSKQQRKKRYESRYIAMAGEMTSQQLQQSIHDAAEEKHRRALYEKHFAALDPRCRKLLTLMLESKSLEELAHDMGYTSQHYVKKLKHVCREKLRKSIQQDPEL